MGEYDDIAVDVKVVLVIPRQGGGVEPSHHRGGGEWHDGLDEGEQGEESACCLFSRAHIFCTRDGGIRGI